MKIVRDVSFLNIFFWYISFYFILHTFQAILRVVKIDNCFNISFLYFFDRETPVVESKVTEKVVEDVEDTPVVASGEENDATPVVDDAPAPETTKTEEEKETPAVESSGVAEVTENGNGTAEVVEPVEETGKIQHHQLMITTLTYFVISEEKVKRKVDADEAPEVPEKRAKTDDVEAVESKEEEVTA